MPLAGHDVIVIGGSTGSIGALQKICAGLPADLPAAVFVVVHVGAIGRNLLAGILDVAGALPAATAEDGQVSQHGRIYVAPADRHLLLAYGVIRLGCGPHENMTRPAIDPLFRSAAAGYGPRVIGAVLSGRLNDGAAGLAAVQRCGGLTVVQSPSDAEAADMPCAALKGCDVHYTAPAADLGPLLAQLARTPQGRRL